MQHAPVCVPGEPQPGKGTALCPQQRPSTQSPQQLPGRRREASGAGGRRQRGRRQQVCSSSAAAGQAAVGRLHKRDQRQRQALSPAPAPPGVRGSTPAPWGLGHGAASGAGEEDGRMQGPGCAKGGCQTPPCASPWVTWGHPSCVLHRPSAPVPGPTRGTRQRDPQPHRHPSSRGTPPQNHTAPSDKDTPFTPPAVHTHRPFCAHTNQAPLPARHRQPPPQRTPRRGPAPRCPPTPPHLPRTPFPPSPNRPVAAGAEGRAGGELREVPAAGVAPAVPPRTHLRGHGAAWPRAGPGWAVPGRGGGRGSRGGDTHRRCHRGRAGRRGDTGAVRGAAVPSGGGGPGRPVCAAARPRRGPPRGGGDGRPPLPARSP